MFATLNQSDRMMMLRDLIGDTNQENISVAQGMANSSQFVPPAMPQNYIQRGNNAPIDLGPSQMSGPALDHSQAPVEIGGYGKGYRLKGDPMTVILGDGRMVRMGADTGADRKRMMDDIALQKARQDVASGQTDHQLKQMQLAELMGLDPTGQGVSNQQSAQALGVPAAPDMYRGISKKQRDILQGKEMLQAEKRLAEEEQAARAQGVSATDANRFKQLNEKTTTGPITGSAPVAWARGIFDDDVQEMKSIQDRLTPKMREPGSGATSDFDAKMFQSALFGVNKQKGANEAIANAMILKSKAEKDRVAFSNAYLQANKTLRGADTAWAKYAEDNPIFDPTSEGIPKLNPARVKWEQYFNGGGKQAAPAGFDADKEARYQAWKAGQGK